MVADTTNIMRVLAAGNDVLLETLGRLPVELFPARTLHEATGHLRRQRNIDALLTHWHLPGGPPGELVRRVKAARPWLTSIVFYDELRCETEIVVRSLGVTALAPATSEAAWLNHWVCQALGIADTGSRDTGEPQNANDDEAALAVGETGT